jgi:hypothetical protein
MALSPGGAAQPANAEAAAQTLKKTMWGPVTYEGRPMMPVYRDLGVGIYATTAHWDQIAPTKPVNPTDPNDPAYTWPSYIEEAIPEAAANGIRVQILIRGTPPWANGGRTANYVATQLSDWTDFVTAVAKRYPTVNLWMIWGEPNRGGPTFAPFTRAKRNVGKLSKAEQVAPRNYAQLLDAAYGALKAKDVEFIDAPHLIAKMPDHDLWMAFLKDSEGNTLALMCEKRPPAA